MSMTENEAIKVLEKPSKHIRMVHKTKNEMEFYTYSADLVEAFEKAISALSEIQQYRVIGTVEELRELKEKATAKKPIPVDSGVYDYDFDFVCPNCGEYVDDVYNYCECGQHLDWSEGKE